MGLWGPFGDYRRTYYSLAKQNETSEILRATALGKKFKATPFATYSEIFPEIENAETLSVGSTVRLKKKQASLAEKALAAFGDSVPDWFLR